MYLKFGFFLSQTQLRVRTMSPTNPKRRISKQKTQPLAGAPSREKKIYEQKLLSYRRLWLKSMKKMASVVNSYTIIQRLKNCLHQLNCFVDLSTHGQPPLAAKQATLSPSIPFSYSLIPFSSSLKPFNSTPLLEFQLFSALPFHYWNVSITGVGMCSPSASVFLVVFIVRCCSSAGYWPFRR